MTIQFGADRNIKTSSWVSHLLHCHLLLYYSYLHQVAQKHTFMAKANKAA